MSNHNNQDDWDDDEDTEVDGTGTVRRLEALVAQGGFEVSTLAPLVQISGDHHGDVNMSNPKKSRGWHRR